MLITGLFESPYGALWDGGMITSIGAQRCPRCRHPLEQVRVVMSDNGPFAVICACCGVLILVAGA